MLTRVASALSPELDQLVHRTIGCALTVHKTLGPGYLESIYHKAMRIELQHQQLAYESERPVTISYRGQLLHSQRIDLIVEKHVVVEVKSVER
jgi:GxxExxY protein